MRKALSLLSILVALSTPTHALTVKNGIQWDKNGNPVCTYGAIKSCQVAAGQGDLAAKAYVSQLQNSKKPATPVPVTCTAASCKPNTLPSCAKAFPYEPGFWGQYKAFKRCV
jgi:hypothetical protein